MIRLFKHLYVPLKQKIPISVSYKFSKNSEQQKLQPTEPKRQQDQGSSQFQIQKYSHLKLQTQPQVQAVPNKSYFMPKPIQNADIYQVNRQIKFKNGRYLIYLNNQNLATPFLLGLHYTIPMSYIAYLIATNPFYLTFPAALPLMCMIEVVLLLFWIQHKSHHKKHIQRIYLLESGMQVQIVYSNKIRRYLKNNEAFTIHNIQDFYPKYDKQVEMGRVKGYPGLRFPADPYILPDKAMKPIGIQYGWTFRDKWFNTFVLPAKYQYSDWEILSKVLNGIIIQVKNPITEGSHFQFAKYPSIQQEQANLQQYRKALPLKPERQTLEQNLQNNKLRRQKFQEQNRIKYQQ